MIYCACIRWISRATRNPQHRARGRRNVVNRGWSRGIYFSRDLGVWVRSDCYETCTTTVCLEMKCDESRKQRRNSLVCWEGVWFTSVFSYSHELWLETLLRVTIEQPRRIAYGDTAWEPISRSDRRDNHHGRLWVREANFRTSHVRKRQKEGKQKRIRTSRLPD